MYNHNEYNKTDASSLASYIKAKINKWVKHNTSNVLL